MGFTIQDLISSSQEKFGIQYVAGHKAWSNSISWPHFIEDSTSLKFFEGKELVITTGSSLGQRNSMLTLISLLLERNASGLILILGDYYEEVPEEIIEYCDENDFPLLTIPRTVSGNDVIQEIGMRIVFQSSTDEQIHKYLLTAIRSPGNTEDYRKELMPYFDVLGDFQVTLVATEGLIEMDTVERRKLSYGLQIYMENITHNGAFLYYNGAFTLITNDVTDEELDEIITGFLENAKRRMKDRKFYVGIGSRLSGVERLSETYYRAKSALTMALAEKTAIVYFDEMGIYRVLYSIKDRDILQDMLNETLRPLMEYDETHEGIYVDTLEAYLRYNGSIQEIAANMYTHRNTVIYRMKNIKKILGCELKTVEERMPYLLAYYIKKML